MNFDPNQPKGGGSKPPKSSQSTRGQPGDKLVFGKTQNAGDHLNSTQNQDVPAKIGSHLDAQNSLRPNKIQSVSPNPSQQPSGNKITDKLGGILKNRLQQAMDDTAEYGSQMSQSKNKSMYKYGSLQNSNAPLNWKQRRERMDLYNMQKAFSFPEMRKLHIDDLTKWAGNDSKGNRKTLYLKQVTTRNDIILKVEEQSRLEKEINYEDRWPLLNLRKSVQKVRIYINMAAQKIISHKAFETITISVILLNSITLGMEDPASVSTTPTDEAIENIFLAAYSIEMVLKILAMGFLFNTGSYLRDPWNLLDFVIVMSAYLTITQDIITIYNNGGVKPIVTAETDDGGALSLNSLRAFRVLRPLRAITSIKGLQVLVVSIMSSIPLLQDTILVLLTFFIVFAIAGTQLLTGILKKRCVNVETGIKYTPDGDEYYLCGGRQTCPEGYFCGKQNENPDFGVTNFDNIMYSLLVVFSCITLEGWSDVMIYFQQSYTDLAFLLFLPMVFIGAFFLINLLLAVINSSFSSSNKEQQIKLAAERERKKNKKRVVRTDESAFDEQDLQNEIGIHTYGITKRVALRMITRLKRIQAIHAAEELERRNRPPEEEEEIRAHVVTLPEPYVPPVEETKKDVKEHNSDSDFSIQVDRYLHDLANEEPQPAGSKSERKVTKVIKHYAVNDMRIGNEMQLPRDDERKKPIKTVEGNQLAVKEDRSPPQSNKNTMSDMHNLEQFLGLDKDSKGGDSGEHPFDLSYVHSQIADYPDFSDDEPQNQHHKEINQSNDEMSAIASDSSYAEKLRPKMVEDSDGSVDETIKVRRSKRRVARTIGQPKARDNLNQTNGSTQLQSISKANDQTANEYDDDLTEKLSAKKKKKKTVTIDPASGVQFDPKDKYSQIKSFIRNTESEFMDVDKSNKDPYQYINKKTHKIELNPGVPYRSTSMDEVFEIRNELLLATGVEQDNKFIKTKKPDYMFIDERIIEMTQGYTKPKCEAYQMKTVYKIHEREEVEFSDDDDDALVLALQPYDTVMSVGYGHLLTHKPIKFVARRSDIIVSSTLSITLTPADSDYRPLDRGTLEPEQLSIWCHKRHEYRGMVVQVASLDFLHDPEYLVDVAETMSPQKVIQKGYTMGGMSSLGMSNKNNDTPELKRGKTINDQDVTDLKFNNQQLEQRKRYIPQTLLQRPLDPTIINKLMEEEKRLYQIQKGKYDTYMRILDKKRAQNEHPGDRQFKFFEVEMLMTGKHHEEEVDDEDEIEETPMKYLSRDESFHQANLENFEMEARKALAATRKVERPPQTYVPQTLMAELDLPGDLEQNIVNFNEVIKKDCTIKRKTPYWSGQDVLDVGLNNELSYWVVDHLNAVRIWPTGLMGLWKKFQVSLKIIVKHKLFDSSMTLAVLLNTVVMGMESHGMSEEVKDFTIQANEWFTWIFIGELTIKLLAIGPKKYLADKMNWLDGGVVSISIFEMLLTAIGTQGGDLKAFNTVRVFRTFRVLRVARLLRSLKSMKVILQVIISSADGFIYITLLMFVFVFIYTLLGMQVFGGGFNFPDGKPRGNYDNFLIGFFTVFQVLTTENWNSVLYDSMRNEEIGYYAPVIYYVSWIFIGNFILLNLFLAILLDGFLSEDDEEAGDEEEIERLARDKRKLAVAAEKARRLKKMGSQIPTTGLQAEFREERRKEQEDQVDDVDDMDEPVIREIFMDEGLIKKKDKAREQRLLYAGISCTNSIYIFHKQNKFRLFCYKVYKHKAFDNFIMFLIAISSLKLGVDSYIPTDPPDSMEMRVSETIDIVLNVLFALELSTKVIAMGLFMDSGSYIRETWNQLDAFIVATSMLDMALTNVDLPVIKILRLLRTLRPLRVISHNVEMKLIVASLFESVGAIFNVIIVVVAVWLMFAIFAINIYAGKFFYCSVGMYTYHTKYECNVNGGSWKRFNYNFDDISQAMLTLFGVASLEGWPDVMVAAVDTTEKDEGPILEASVINGFFFILFILVGSFFLMNFFVGVLFLKYTQAQKAENKGFTAEHQTWKAIQKMIVECKCDHTIMNKPDGTVHPKRLYYWKIVTSQPFDIGILGVIVLNIVQMGIMFENEPVLYTQLLDYSNYIFTFIFTMEAYFKLRAFSYRYFETAWNKFDFFIVVTSLMDIIIGFTSNEGEEQNEILSLGPQVARLLRVLRVTRVVRLAKRNQGLQALMSTITLSVGPLMNVFLLLLLALFIFAILAVFFFAEVRSGEFLGEYRNYENFGQSFLTLFVIATGENWNGLMYDCLNTPPDCEPGETCGTSLAPLFYIIFVIFIQNVMLNLFILVILTQFEMYYMSDDNPIKKFQKSLNVFMVTWIFFTQTRYRCLKLREKKLNDFFRELPMPLGLPFDTTDDQMKKVMLKMGIRCDDGYVYFNELLYRCMRRQYGNFRLNRKMQILELKTQYRIYQITIKQQNVSLKQEIYEQFFSKMIGNGKSVNPFLLQMYYHISFNTWINFTRRNQKRERHYIKQEKLRNKAVKEGRSFVPEDYTEEKEQLQQVTIEVEEVVFYTSEEASEEEPEKGLDDKNKTKSSLDKSEAALKSKLLKKRTTMGSGQSNRISTISGLSGQKKQAVQGRRGETINVSSQQLLPDGQQQTNSNKQASSGTL